MKEMRSGKYLGSIMCACVCMCACASNAHLPRSFLSGNEQANFVCLIMSCFQKSRNGRRCE